VSIRIEWSNRAARQLLRLEQRDQRRVRDAVNRLVDFPAAINIKHLVNHDPPYRLRVGKHRVLFSFDGAQRLIIIESVRRRNEHTY
jgi:mRNA-degrading endonuclease RelE of RelBE toxin-antitoxin system